MGNLSSNTHLIQQYHSIRLCCNFKTLIFFQVGEFYEVLYNDAHIISQESGIILSERRNSDTPVPMAGFPKSSLLDYVVILCSKGYRVAVCVHSDFQDTRVSKRSSTRILLRYIDKIYTPGNYVLFNDNNQISVLHNVIVLFFYEGDVKVGVYNICDSSLSFFKTNTNNILDFIQNFSPKEVIIYGQILRELFCSIEALYPCVHLKEVMPTGSFHLECIKSNDYCVEIINILGHFFVYMCCCKDFLSGLRINTNFVSDTYISSETLNSLEIVKKRTFRSKSLFSEINFCRTANGQRMLMCRLYHPVYNKKILCDRYSGIEALIKNRKFIEIYEKNFIDCVDVGTSLLRRKQVKDFSIIYQSVLVLDQVFCFAKDLYPFLEDFNECLEIKNAIHFLQKSLSTQLYSVVQEIMQNTFYNKITREMDLVSEQFPQMSYKQQEMYHLQQDIRKLEKIYRSDLKMHKLKICENKSYGYSFVIPYGKYCDIRNNLDEHPFLFKKIRSNDVVCSTDDLGVLSYKINIIREEIRLYKCNLFQSYLDKIHQNKSDVYQISFCISMIDCYYSLAQWSVKNKATRPRLSSDGTFSFIQGIHPLICGNNSVPNDLNMSSKHRSVMITGPNMSGKSVYIKQCILIAYLAQCGSFVPVKECTIDPFQNIFFHSEQGDSLTKKQSTFFSEIKDISIILKKTTQRSLVSMDEPCRGTSYKDTIAIVSAIVSFMHQRGNIFLLFTTHHHDIIRHIDNLVPPVDVFYASYIYDRDKGEVRFLYKICPGLSLESYGLAVLRSCSIDSSIVDMARLVLLRL